MIIGDLTIEGSETSFELLRLNYEMASRAFYYLAKSHNNSGRFIDLAIEFYAKAKLIAEEFGGVENEK